MNPNALRGLAALCLLCVLPRLGATVMTVSQTLPVYGFTTGQSSAGGSALWHMPTFDPTLGILESVTWRATAVVSVSAYSAHIFWNFIFEEPTARLFTPYTQLELIASPFGIADNLGSWGSDYSAGEPRMVQPYEVFGHQHVHTVSLEDTVTNPDDLARFSGGLPPLGDYGLGTFFSVRGGGYGRYGNIELSGNITATIEYTYRISESGYSAALLAAALLGLVAVRRLVSVAQDHGSTSVPTLS